MCSDVFFHTGDLMARPQKERRGIGAESKPVSKARKAYGVYAETFYGDGPDAGKALGEKVDKKNKAIKNFKAAAKRGKKDKTYADVKGKK
jgi:hypothetical protein